MLDGMEISGSSWVVAGSSATGSSSWISAARTCTVFGSTGSTASTVSTARRKRSSVRQVGSAAGTASTVSVRSPGQTRRNVIFVRKRGSAGASGSGGASTKARAKPKRLRRRGSWMISAPGWSKSAKPVSSS